MASPSPATGNTNTNTTTTNTTISTSGTTSPTSPISPTSTTPALITKPKPAVINPASSPPASQPNSPSTPSRSSLFPLPHLRRPSWGGRADSGDGDGGGGGGSGKRGSNAGNRDSSSKVPSSPPVANRRVSAQAVEAAQRAAGGSRLSGSSTNPLADAGDTDSGWDKDLEKGVKLEDLSGLRKRRELMFRRKSSGAAATIASTAATPDNGAAGGDAQTDIANTPRPSSLHSRPSTLHEETDEHDRELAGVGGSGVGDLPTNPETDEEDEDDGWDHFHPCFPHPNPHIPVTSPLYQTTRIIRVPRNFMINGDNSPAYSIIYPDLLKAYMTEEEFREIVDTLNEKLRLAFDPWNVWNWVDGMVGLLTCWLWEEVRDTYVKRKLKEVERYIDGWNRRLEGDGVKVISLKRTGYINLDIQIPDPLKDTESVLDDNQTAVNGAPPPAGRQSTATDAGDGDTDADADTDRQRGKRQHTLSDASGTIPTVIVNGRS